MNTPAVRMIVVSSLIAVAMAAAVPARAAEGTKPAATDKKMEQPKHQFYSGVIEAIDAKANTVAIKHKEESKTFQFAPNCRFMTHEKKTDATVADFKTGDKVLVSYAEEDGKLICLKMGPAPTPPPPKPKSETKPK